MGIGVTEQVVKEVLRTQAGMTMAGGVAFLTAPLVTNPTISGGTIGSDVTIMQATGSAGSRTTLTARKGALVDNTATAMVTVTVPNNIHGGVLRIFVMGQLSDGDSTHSVEHLVSFSRITGANAKAVASAAVGSAKTTGATADATTTVAVSAVSGAVGANNTFDITVKVARSAGASDGHTAVVFAELLNGQTGGITMAAAA